MAQQCLPTPKPQQRAKVPPRSSVREAPFRLVRDATVDGQPDDGLTLDGYGAVFNRLTLIDSWEGRFWEQIAAGSMKRSFKDTPPKIQFDHGRHPLIGSLPVASLVSVTEDSDPVLAPDGGAHIIGRLMDNWLVQPVRDAIAAGAVDGMSFRFEVMQEQWAYPDGKVIRDQQELMAQLDRTYFEDVPDDELLIRTLKQLKVPEMGPVTWPAYEDTSVGVRSKLPRVLDLGKLGEPETRKHLARAVFLADRLEASQDGARQQDTPSNERKEPGDLAGSLDAIIDQANGLLEGQDTSDLPDNVAQAVALIQGAGGVSDDLLDSLGVYDPDEDDDEDDESDDDDRSGQLTTDTAGQHPTGQQRATRDGQAGTPGRQHATDSAGEHQSVQSKRMSNKDLRLRNQRSQLLTFRDIGERP